MKKVLFACLAFGLISLGAVAQTGNASGTKAATQAIHKHKAKKHKPYRKGWKKHAHRKAANPVKNKK
ncbi:MAG TPA: hypothetical protein VG842_12565 [Sediminibacterium sp.]|nr:hypothetical protein [Sediminibacterium sp.]